jgi:hypothetical protein
MSTARIRKTTGRASIVDVNVPCLSCVVKFRVIAFPKQRDARRFPERHQEPGGRRLVSRR